MRKSEFVKSVENRFCATLTPLGFVSRGRVWIRYRSEFIDCVDLQIRTDGLACCVNLGVHLSFLPSADGSNSFDPKASSTVDCEIKARLAPDKMADYWWDFTSGLQGVESLVGCFREIGLSFFDQYIDFPLPFTKVTMAEISSEATLRLMPTMTKVRRILLLARIYDYLNDEKNAVIWANFGKDNCGMAVGPQAIFIEILRKFGHTVK